MGFSICKDTNVCTISKVIGINKEKGICLPNKEYTNGHRYERANMVYKCKIFINCIRNFIGIGKKQI